MATPKNSLAKKVGEMDGFCGSRDIYEVSPGLSTNVVSSHSCLLPRFSMTFRVGELRRIIEKMEDDDNLTVTVHNERSTTLTFVR